MIDQATQDRIAPLLAIVKQSYGRDAKGEWRFSLTDMALSVWCKLLADIPHDALQAAVQQHLATNKWPPTIADLRDAARLVTATEIPTAGQAWAEVTRMMESAGSSAWRGGDWEPSWSHPLIGQAVAAMGGYDRLCAAEDPDGVLRAQWDRAFNGLVNREEAETKLLPEVKALRDAHRQALPAPADERRLIAAPTNERQSAGGFAGAGSVMQFVTPPSKNAPLPNAAYADRVAYLERMKRIQDDPDGVEAQEERARAQTKREAANRLAERDAQGVAKREAVNG